MQITPDTDIQTIKKILKSMGYKMKTKTFSWGKHVIYHHIESNHDLTGNVFTSETLEKWIPLFNWIKENRENLKIIGKKNGLTALDKN